MLILLLKYYAVLQTFNEQRNILREIRKLKANWIGHILRRNCLLKQVIEGKIKGEMDVTRRPLLPRRPGRTNNILNFFLSGLKKLEQWARKCIELRGEYEVVVLRKTYVFNSIL